MMKKALSILFLCFLFAIAMGWLKATFASVSEIQQSEKKIAGEKTIAFRDLGALPVQSRGRVKPFDTFARETLRFIYGKTHFQKQPATTVLISWLLNPIPENPIPDFARGKKISILPKDWDKTKFIHITDFKLKQAFQLNVKESLFSPEELLMNSHFVKEIKELDSRLANKVPLDDYFKAVAKVKNRLLLYQAFQKGRTPGWIPADSTNQKPWRTLSDFTEQEKKLFQKVLLFTYYQLDFAKHAVKDFWQAIHSQYPIYDRQKNKISAELHYNFLNPLRLSWILYLLGFLFLLLWFLTKSYQKSHQNKPQKAYEIKIFFGAGLVCLISAFFMQGYGMVLRSYIMSRPPVTNMYETVIWVPWVTVLLGAWLWLRQKMFSVFVCSTVVALFCLLLADLSPELLDGSLHPLEAVLRSSFWLIVHVLTITISYGAFFLAFALGNVVLFLFLRQNKGDKSIQTYIRCIDRSLQIGVVLLTAGTILGGVWADYSWGRFWGWDPKETWALISLLAYLVLLHSRLMGYVKEFGMAVCSVLLFFFIIMAWYGVNYVLGKGLHSYGFGAGGVEYVLGFALLQVVYVLCVYAFRPAK